MKTLLRYFFICALVATNLFCVQAVHAATFTVNKLADTNDGTCDADCSLREAIAAANTVLGNDTISFASAVSGTITLVNGELAVNTNITLTGPGANALTISGNNTSRIFSVGEANFSVFGLTLANGAYVTTGYLLAEGGAIINYGNLTLRRCVLQDNFVQSAHHAMGGAIATLATGNGASLNLVECSLLNNRARPGNHESGYAFGFTKGGALYSAGYQNTATVSVSNCTFAHNQAFYTGSGTGGAVYNDVQVDSVFTNCTFYYNVAEIAGAIYNRSSQLTLNHCTVSHNSTSAYSHITNDDKDFGPATLHLNHTLFTHERTYVNSSYSGGSITSQFIMHIYEDELGPLEDNGGSTPTMALPPDCPAIDAGDPNFAPPPNTDQRGFPRIRNTRIDIGAFETLLSSALSINDVTLVEGNGSTNATFTVTLTAPSDQTVTVNAITANGTTKAPADYSSNGVTLSFTPGETSKTFSVPVQGDFLDEVDETFFVLLSSPVNATIARGRGMGTILDDDAAPTISIDDISVKEYSAGQTTAAVRLKLSSPSGQVVRVSYATANGTAIVGSDYVAVAPTSIAFNTGSLYAYARVLINGDLFNEPNETFFVNLSSPNNAVIADAQGIGTILNDDSAPALSINDVSITEGNAGTKQLTFTVTLSKTSGQTITVNYATADGIARSTSDYIAKNGTLSFAPGSALTRTISITINGDTLTEGDETLYVLLSGALNASVGRARGTGNIINDDSSG